MSSHLSEVASALTDVLIEVPHWLATVALFDNDLKLVSLDERVEQVPGETFLGRLVTRLTPGAYQVVVTLDGRMQSKWILADIDTPVEIRVGTWSDLMVESSMPLPAAAPAARGNDRFARIAKIGAPRQAQADARLSLFGTAIEPYANRQAQGDTGRATPCLTEEDGPRDFDWDVMLLDAAGAPVVDLSSASVRRHVAPRRLWRCFLDLKPGPYLLRARIPPSRSHVDAPPRYRVQALFLCPSLDHHLFVRCDGPPDLATLTMHVTRLGERYDPLRPEAMAADGVLAALAHGQAQQLLLGSGTLAQMLQGEAANPWLGVLAAYGLMSGPVDDAIRAQIDDIVAFLQQGPLRDHPDVQVLMIRDGVGPGPLHHPPMLLAAMRRLQRLAIEHTGLIAPDSALERLTSRLVADTAWTAWIEGSAPMPAPPGPASDPEPVGSLPPPIQAFVEAFPDSAPVYPLTLVDPLSPEEAVRQNATLADHAAIIEAASEALDVLCRTGESGLEVSFTATASRTLLDMSPEEVSRLTGMSLDVVIRDLELLRTTPVVAADLDALERPLQLLAAAILGRQTQVVSRHLEEGEPPSPPSPMESQARRLADEARRVGKMKDAELGLATALAPIAEAMERGADSLIKRAHLVILADDRGRLRYGNKLLRDRLEAREEGAEAVISRMMRVFANQDRDHMVVNAAELSPTSPEGRAGADIEIRRTALSDGAHMVGFIYLLRDLRYPELTRAAARQVDALLPLITLSASMLEFAGPSERAGHVSRLSEAVRSLSDLLGIEYREMSGALSG